MAELDKSSNSESSGSLDKDDVIKFLGDDSDDKEIIPLEDKEDKKEKKEPKKAAKDPDESEEVEVELEDKPEKSDDKNLELLSPVSKTDVLKKYPNLFKDFPELETTHNREQAFTERFPTIKDADNALRDSETLEKFEADLIDGNTENMLMAAKQADPDAFKRIVDNYLTTLGQVDEKAYYHVIGNTIKYTIMQMVEEAKSSSDDKLREAAEILNHFMFGSSKFEPPRRLIESRAKDPDAAKLANEKKEFTKQRFETVSEELYSKIIKSVKSTVDTHIDPRNEMREYDKRNATRDVLTELDSLITKDSRFKTVMDGLWKDAAKNNYSKESVGKIQSLFFSKAKNLLPGIIEKARKEALSGAISSKKAEPKNEEKKEKPNKEPSRSNHPNNKKQEIPRGMTTFEFLNAED